MLSRSREWAVRCMHEYKTTGLGMFLTLTIDSERKLYDSMDYTLNRRDIQLFIKRLRKSFYPQQIRFFYCGEYGARRLRPHYHVLVFGARFNDLSLWKVQRPSGRYSTYNHPICLYRSPELERLWPFGFSTVGELNFRTAAYTARYCLKKAGILSKHAHYGDRVPEFIGCSLKPGIGYEYFMKYYKDFYSVNHCFDPEHRPVKIPRYYDKLYERICPDSFSMVKEYRRSLVEKISPSEFTPERLDIKEKCVIMRLSDLIRAYENCLEGENL